MQDDEAPDTMSKELVVVKTRPLPRRHEPASTCQPLSREAMDALALEGLLQRLGEDDPELAARLEIFKLDLQTCVEDEVRRVRARREALLRDWRFWT
jgi:hypothetical protein